MPRYGMVIDLKRCYGCYACSMACKTANHTPPGVFWARVLMGEVGTYPNAVRQALPVLCMQCEEPSCMEVCPTGARVFGDLNDPDSEIRYIIKNKRTYVLKEDAGTIPAFFYYFDA